MAAVAAFPAPVGRAELELALTGRLSARTLRDRLASLVRAGRLRQLGERRWTEYALPESGSADVEARAGFEAALSTESLALLDCISRPVAERAPSRYRRDYANGYLPNTTRWLEEDERRHLHALGTVPGTRQPAGTYARNILDRLLIDLSFNSSRLESNTYSLLDTRRLLELGVEADGHDPREAQMIRNHRDAIEFLVENADETGFDRRTMLNLHAALASELLPDPLDAGRLRGIPVGIGQSTYLPETVPQVIEKAFAELLARLAAIDDPFEQALVTLARLPYLQPFVDVNERVSRLAANMPLIRTNLVPVSFVDVPRDLYTKALLAVYELRDHGLLKELFLRAYERSAMRYTEVRQSLDAPDPFRVRYRERLVELVSDSVRSGVRLRVAASFARTWTAANVAEADRQRFAEMAESELLGLHEGNFVRFRLRPSEFDAWHALQVEDRTRRGRDGGGGTP